MILRDQGDLNGSAVHVVESAPPSTASGSSRSTPNLDSTSQSWKITSQKLSQKFLVAF